ncbi:MAG: sensor histidine kinase [Thermoplasmata archaeon]
MDIINKVRELRKVDVEDLKDVNLNQVIDDVLEDSKNNTDPNNIDIISKIDSDNSIIVKGGKLLKTLFINLIENAVKHAECDRIVINGEIKGDHYLITLEDDGKGISDDKKEDIFERGFKYGKQPGTGLGLYMVKRIVENYGGSVEVKDSELGGTRFDIYLKRSNQ